LSSHRSLIARQAQLPCVVTVMSLFAVFGCSFFPVKTGTPLHSTGRPVLPPIQAAPESIQLEIFFLERPAQDHLLTTDLWKEVDQLGGLSTETRDSLTANGLRVGNVSSNPPPAVQKLLGMSAEIPADSSENARPIMGRRQYLASGVETEIPTGIIHERCEFQLREGQTTRRIEYDNVGGVLRMKANRLQEGWVRIDFQPEIHYGEKQMRRAAAEEEWELRLSQQMDIRFAQRFSLKMNVGEMVMITATTEDEGSLGDRFFCHQDRGLKKQRILIIRVVDSGQSAASLAR